MRTPEVIACLAFLWLLYSEVFGGIRKIERAAEREGARSRAYHAGLKLAVLTRCALMLVTGLYALDGSLVALVLFALAVAWSAILRGTDIGRGFATGFHAASGRYPKVLAASVGVAVVAVTHGVPLVAIVRNVGRS